MREFLLNYRNLCPGAREGVAKRTLGDTQARSRPLEVAKLSAALAYQKRLWGRNVGICFGRRYADSREVGRFGLIVRRGQTILKMHKSDLYMRYTI